MAASASRPPEAKVKVPGSLCTGCRVLPENLQRADEQGPASAEMGRGLSVRAGSRRVGARKCAAGRTREPSSPQGSDKPSVLGVPQGDSGHLRP